MLFQAVQLQRNRICSPWHIPTGIFDIRNVSFKCKSKTHEKKGYMCVTMSLALQNYRFSLFLERSLCPRCFEHIWLLYPSSISRPSFSDNQRAMTAISECESTTGLVIQLPVICTSSRKIAFLPPIGSEPDPIRVIYCSSPASMLSFNIFSSNYISDCQLGRLHEILIPTPMYDLYDLDVSYLFHCYQLSLSLLWRTRLSTRRKRLQVPRIYRSTKRALMSAWTVLRMARWLPNTWVQLWTSKICRP